MAKSTSALPIIAAAAALVVLTDKKKKSKASGGNVRWGVRVSPDCKAMEIVNPKLFNQFLYGAFDELVSADPSLTLIQMTDALFGDVAPNCAWFPEEPESEHVAELYAVIARGMGQFMVTDPRVDLTAGGMIDQATQISFTDWYRNWRNYPSSELPDGPSDEVSFSSDFTTYVIGSNWYANTLFPFVQEAARNGRIDSAYNDFVANRGVLVGQFVQPILELPDDAAAVEHFLDALEEAVEQATAEVSEG